LLQGVSDMKGLAAGAVGTILQSCSEASAELACGAQLWPETFLAGATQMLELRKVAADNRTSEILGKTWNGTVPPCTNISSRGDCVLCEDDQQVRQQP